MVKNAHPQNRPKMPPKSALQKRIRGKSRVRGSPGAALIRFKGNLFLRKGEMNETTAVATTYNANQATGAISSKIIVGVDFAAKNAQGRPQIQMLSRCGSALPSRMNDWVE